MARLILNLLHFCQFMASPVTFITRLRLDAALYEPVPPVRASPAAAYPKDLLGHPRAFSFSCLVGKAHFVAA